MTMDDPNTLVSTDWLSAHLEDPELRLLDASWYLPDQGRDARAEYAAGHIPGARFVDLATVSDTSSELPHMAPAPEAFGARMRALGVGDGHRVVVYDGAGLFSAARVWWLLRHMGKPEVAVLDGGLPKWRGEGRPLSAAPFSETEPAAGDAAMTAARHAKMRDATQVAEATRLGSAQIVDARPPARFRGDTPEPRPGLRAGHIPGACNLPFPDLLAEDATMLPPEALRARFEAAGIDLARPVITSCGSGVTAAIVNLALARLGREDHALYDGSWAEWGMEGGPEVARG